MGDEVYGYKVVDKHTLITVLAGFKTRAAARQAKREFELKKQQETGSANRPSAYYVETPDGRDIH